MTNITINYKKNTIEITKAFEKKASAYGSEAYIELSEARKEFPNYRLVVKTSKSNNTFAGMDYDFMVEYIEKHYFCGVQNMRKNVHVETPRL